MYKYILLILLANKKYLIIFLISIRWLKIIYKVELIYFFIINNKDIKIINKAWCF